MQDKTYKNVADFYLSLAKKAALTDNIHKLAESIIAKTVSWIKADSGSIMVFDSIENCLKLYVSARHPSVRSKQLKTERINLNEGIAGDVFRTGKPIIVEDTSTYNASNKLSRKNDHGSFLSVPLKVSNRISGVINFNRSPDKKPFTKSQLTQISQVAILIAGLIEKETLMNSVKESHQEISGLYELSGILAQTTDFTSRLELFLKTLSVKLELEKSAIIKIEKDKKIEIIASHKVRGERLYQIFNAVFLRIKQFLHDTQLENEAIPHSLNYSEKDKNYEMFCLPVLVSGKPSHILMVSRKYADISSEMALKHCRFLYLISQSLSTAIERESMLEKIRNDQKKLEENAQRNSIFVEISKDLTSTLDPQTILQKSFDQFRNIITYTSISILLYDDLENKYRLIIQPAETITEKYKDKIVDNIRQIVSEYPLKPKLSNSNIMGPVVFNPHNHSQKSVRTIKQTMHLPVIIGEKVSGLIHLARKENKPYSNTELDITSQFTAIFITSIKNAQIHKKTEKLAFTDPLTGLFNHRYFQETLSQEFIRARRYKKPLSLMIIDIDFFKKFNDTHGHQAGDMVLKVVAEIFSGSVREQIDTSARYGGEEFAVILPETSLEGAINFAERVRKKVEKTKINYQNAQLSVTLSIGVACSDVTHCNVKSELIEAADRAMYNAKTSGRNMVKPYRDETVK